MPKSNHRDSSRRYLYPLLITVVLLAMAGIWLFLQGNTPSALKHLREAARLEPGNGQYSFVLAVALHDGGQVDKACQQLEDLLKRQPYNRNARLSLIQYYLENGHEPKAQGVMQGWKKLNPGDPALK